MKKISCILAGVLLLSLLTACAGPQETVIEPEPAPQMGAPVGILPAEGMPEAPEVEQVSQKEHFSYLTTEHPGILEKKNANAVIDYSNTKDGYVMVQYTAKTDKLLKARVKGPKTTYTYNLTEKTWAAFPLSEGDGQYKITVYRNTTGSKYATVLSVTVNVKLDSPFEPFLRPNQYVDFSVAPETVKLGASLTKGTKNDLQKVAKVYDYVVSALTYDKKKAATVKSGYLPVLDEVLEEKTGICFDYAALMTGMLRSQGVPCKLVVGYAGKAYHAWISVWTEEHGWVDGAIFFDGQNWQRMDPTFASSGKRSDSIMEYIGDGSNYTEKYLY